MHEVIEMLADAGATGTLAGVHEALAGGCGAIEAGATSRTDAGSLAAALAGSLGVQRHLACMVFTPDNDPMPQDVPADPDEDAPENPAGPQTPGFRESRAA